MDVKHEEIDGREFLVVDEEVKPGINFLVRKPKNEDGTERLQYADMERNMRYAASLQLPVLQIGEFRPFCKALIIGAGPSLKPRLEEIKRLAAVPGTGVFAVNWTHTLLINHGVVPTGCLLFEVDAEPEYLLKSFHKDVDYYICSHCNQGTFDALEGYKRILWHAPPQDEATHNAREELFDNQIILGGGSATFMLSISLALCLGYREFEVFGVDGSYTGDSTHVEGYPAAVNAKDDGMDVYARHPVTQEVRHFRSVGYLAHQVEEFAKFCNHNHQHFRMRMHGDGMMQWQHKIMFPQEYERK